MPLIDLIGMDETFGDETVQHQADQRDDAPFDDHRAGGVLIPVSYTHLDVYKRQRNMLEKQCRRALS